MAIVVMVSLEAIPILAASRA